MGHYFISKTPNSRFLLMKETAALTKPRRKKRHMLLFPPVISGAFL